ncbi:MAG: TonB-dependent receptor [Saprospiraceae bacterium]
MKISIFTISLNPIHQKWWLILGVLFFISIGTSFAFESSEVPESILLNNSDAFKSITGTVIDANGDAIIGATVLIKGTTTGTATDFDGTFSLDANEGDIIVISYLGYNSIEIPIGSSSNYSISLTEGAAFMDEVVVTGTRSRPRTVISSPVPIDNFQSKELERQGNGDLTETLKNLVPSFTATPLTGDGAAFVRPTSMRGLPPDETLILMNSKRRHRSSLISHFGAAMNAGAHAADIGQIPSIALKNIEVLRDGASAQYGSDAIAGVMNFILKDASHGVEIQTQVGQWYGKNYGAETDYKFAANVGLPLTKKGFLNISGEYAFNEELSRGVQHAAAIGVEGVQNPAMNWGRPESSGLRTVWNAGIEISENVEAYSFGNFSDTYGNYGFFYRPPGRSGVLEPIPNDPQDPSKGNFCWCDDFPAGFTPRFEGFQTDISTVIGIRGKLDNGWNYDISGTYGSNRINYVLNNSLNSSWGPFSQQVFRPGDIKQSDLNFNFDVSKELSDQFNLALGFERRRETYTLFAGDEQSWKGGPWANVSTLTNPETGSNYAPPGLGANGFSGTARENSGAFDSKNWAFYLDGEWDVNDDFLIQMAVRHEDFTEFGSTDNFKIASRYTISDKFTLRGAVSTGFRAPTSGQANVVTIVTTFDGMTGTQVQQGTIKPTNPLAVSLGGKALVPEEALNISFGFASRPTSALSLTLDFYQIEVDKRIIKSRNLAVIGNPNFSSIAFYSNSLNTKTTGLDLVTSLRTNEGRTNFSLAYNYNKTKVVSQEQVNGENPVSDGTIFNLENNLPKSRASLMMNHDFGKVSGMIRANYYGSTIDERGTREEVGDEILIDVELSYSASDKLRLILGANNVLNNYPDEIDTRISQGMPYPRRTPIGYHGGMVYFRAVYNID